MAKDSFEVAYEHQTTKDFIENTNKMLEGYVIEGFPQISALRGIENTYVDVSFYYESGLKENKGLNKMLKTNGWEVRRREFSDYNRENKTFGFKATKTINLSD